MSKANFNICNVEMVSEFFYISSQLQVVIYEVCILFLYKCQSLLGDTNYGWFAGQELLAFGGLLYLLLL